MTTSTIALAIRGVFGGGGGGPASPPKDEGWLGRLADAFKRHVGKAVEKLFDIVVSVFNAVLSFLRKAVGSVAEHTWTLIVSVLGLIGWWLMQSVKKG